MAKKTSAKAAAKRTSGRSHSSTATQGHSTPRSKRSVSHAEATDRAPRPEPGGAAKADTSAASQTTRLSDAAETLGRLLGKTAAAVTDLLPGGSSDGLELLERDHRRLEALLMSATATAEGDGERRTELLATIARELKAHELIEEKILYPALKTHAKARDIVLEGYQEHHVADVLLRELQELNTSDERWGAKMKVLQESLEHHIEEEEGEMFKTARSIMPREQLDELGERMKAMKSDALQGDAG